MDKINFKDVLDYNGTNLNFITNEPYSEIYKKLGEKWSLLPLYTDYDAIKKFFNFLETKQVILLVSGTGSGKTVFIPKFFLKYLITLNIPGKIAITNPKQITTLNNAKYGAVTLDVELGKEVGYSYKDAPRISKSENTRLLYLTDGILSAAIKSGNKLLSEYAGVIIDEAHERNIQIDFLLKFLKEIVLIRKDFKVIIMSATINTDIFKKYYNIENINYGEIFISGKPNFPIKQIFLEEEILDYMKVYMKTALNRSIKIINKNINEDIIIFVPTQNDTSIGCGKLRMKVNTDKLLCIEFHSKTSENQKDLAMLKNNDKQKIIFTTNVAESSITFDGLVYVIDTGLELTNHFNSHDNLYEIKKIFTTQSQIIQRIGRTGRTQPGIAYHLYTKEQFDEFKKYPEPNILVTDLTNDILSLFKYYKNINELTNFLSDLITQPTQEQINNSIYKLECYNCITFTDNGRLTSIGKSIQKISSTFNFISTYAIIIAKYLNCQVEIVKIMCIVNEVDGAIEKLFNFIKLNKFKKYMETFSYPNSDHITLLNIYEQLYEKQKYEYLDIKIFNKISKEIKNILKNLEQLTDENYEHINKTYNIIQIKPFDNINDNILYTLYKAYQLNIIYNNKTLNFQNNIKGTINFNDITINDSSKDNEIYICESAINRFGKILFICCSLISKNII